MGAGREGTNLGCHPIFTVSLYFECLQLQIYLHWGEILECIPSLLLSQDSPKLIHLPKMFQEYGGDTLANRNYICCPV